LLWSRLLFARYIIIAMTTIPQFMSPGSPVVRRKGRSSGWCAIMGAWTWRFLLLCGSFRTAFCVRSSENLNDLETTLDIRVQTSPNVEHSITSEIKDDAVAHKAKELRLAAVGNNLESYNKNWETVVAKTR